MGKATQIWLPEHWPVAVDWTPVLAPYFSSARFQDLWRFVSQQRSTANIYPAAEDVFNAFRFCTFEKTKVVILGQDPYHGAGQAHGLSFSVQGPTKQPPSLRNIFKELHADLGIDNEATGDLTSWANQGVLLLNTVLTVQEGQANSHRQQGWEDFTDHVLERLNQRTQGVVFILWGKQASDKLRQVQSHHFVLRSPHPSPLSAYHGFWGSQPFSKTNEALQQMGQPPINWQL